MNAQCTDHDYEVVDYNPEHDRLIEACKYCGIRHVRPVDEEKDVEP